MKATREYVTGNQAQQLCSWPQAEDQPVSGGLVTLAALNCSFRTLQITAGTPECSDGGSEESFWRERERETFDF